MDKPTSIIFGRWFMGPIYDDFVDDLSWGPKIDNSHL